MNFLINSNSISDIILGFVDGPSKIIGGIQNNLLKIKIRHKQTYGVQQPWQRW
jgi:hypothetical protein